MKYIKIALFFISLFTLTACSNKSMNNSVFSHRGASGEEVEHTFAAYDLAIDYGSQNIEQDLVTSKNGTLFVSHDLSAKRITGVNKLYSDMTDEEIRQLKTINDEPILALQDVFDKYKDSVNYIIELKENNKQTNKFIDIVNKNNLSKSIIVQVSNTEPLDLISKKFPNMEKLLLIKEQKDILKATKNSNVDIISINKEFLTKNNVALVHNANKKINVWTVDSTKEITNAITLNVDSYFTNYTAKALLLEKKYK